MQAFRIHKGLVVPLDRSNIDTDQIIPKQFLKRVERSGFGEFLFYDWRRQGDFILDRPAYHGACVLATGANFGCGSSREHAPWSLLDYGFRAIIAPSFADIFANNCLKNGMLPVVLMEEEVAELTSRAQEVEGYEITVDLEKKLVSDAQGFSATFAIGDFQRHCLLEGLDDIGLTLRHEDAIAAFESKRIPWLSARNSAEQTA